MTPAKCSTRREVYRHSSVLRHKLNKQKRGGAQERIGHIDLKRDHLP